MRNYEVSIDFAKCPILTVCNALNHFAIDNGDVEVHP